MSLSLDRMKEENDEAIKNLEQTIDSLEQSIQKKKDELNLRLEVAAALDMRAVEAQAQLPKFDEERLRNAIKEKRG